MKAPKRWPTILILVLAQLAWLCFVVLLTVWYVTKYARGHHLGTFDVAIIAEISVLLLLILAGLYTLFILYQRQLTLVRTQMNLLSSVTHEFKTPLATMQLYLETVKTRDLPEETRTQLLDGMLQENHRLQRLVEHLLESARATNARRAYRRESLDLTVYIAGFYERHASLLEGVSITTDIAPDLTVSFDPRAFDLALSNLADNAIHYSKGEPRIDLKAWGDERWIYLDFADWGIGIPEDKRRDVFKMFQRLPEGTRHRSSGSGMGLFVVREIIRAHGGRIQIKQPGHESGTSFLIRLPRSRS